MPKHFSANPHRTLTLLVAANIVFDVIAIVIWAALPANVWNGLYRLDTLAAKVEAALAAIFFAVTLFGLIRNKKWAPFLAIGITVTQRVFAFYIFFPSIALPIPLVWSLVIVYFAIKDMKACTKFQDFRN